MMNSPTFRRHVKALAGCVVVVTLCGWLAAGAQEQKAPELYSPRVLAELKLLQKAALESGYAYEQVAHLTNVIGPRLSGSAQAQHAVNYVAEELRRLGLAVSLEKVTVPHWVRGAESCDLTEYPGRPSQVTQKVVVTALGGSVATPTAGVTADVVVAENYDELEALGRKQIAGKILLFNNRFDQRLAAQGLGGEAYEQAVVFRSRGAIDASYFGAVAVLVRSVGGGGYRLPHTGITAYDPAIPKIPAGAVTAEDADLIAGLAARGKVQARLVLTPQSLPETTSYNVVADLKGTEHPEQVVIVSGHLDSWDLGTGALDDAAGVATAMAAVELVRRLDLRPRRTIRVVAWMGEECGSPGAWAYAKQHEGELAHHVAAIESDLGAGHPVGFKAKIKDKAMAWLSPVSAILDAQGAGGIRPVDGTEADLTPLAYAGVPAFGLWQDSRTYFNFHHTAADTIDKIVPAELAENAAAMVVMAYALANATEPLLR